MNDSPGTTGTQAALVAAALLASAIGSLFAAGDGSLHALAEPRVQVLTQQEGPVGVAFRRYQADRQRILARWLVARIVATSIAAVLYARVAETWLESAALGVLASVIAAVLTYGTFAEGLLTLGRRRPEWIGGFVLRFLQPLEWAMVPLAEPLAKLGRIVGARYAPKRPLDARTTETEVQWVVTQGERAGALGNEPAEMIRNVLEFKDITAREVMVPRRRIAGIEVSTPLERAVGIVANDGHSRYPVYRETLDNIVGLLYAKDLFALVKDKRLTTTKLAEIVRSPVLFVVETQPILSILKEMRARRLHMAVVSDEFGGTSGVVTLEDIIEEIVGEIRDEYDTDEGAQITELPGGHFFADAAVPLADLSARLGRELPLPAEAEFESLGGLLIHQAGKVPEIGATLTLDGLKFIVRERDDTRVVKVEIIPSEPAGDTSAAPPATSTLS